MDGKTAVPFTFEEYLAGVQDSVASTISQLFFLDDIRFVDSQITVSTTPITENQTATIRIDFTPLDATQSTTLHVEFGDGQTHALTLGAGVTQANVTHQYPDDGPSGAQFFDYRVAVTTDNTASTGFGTQRVTNVAPVITSVTIGPGTSIDEGEEVTVQGMFTDQGPRDTFVIRIDWGDGSAATLINHTALNGTEGTFSATHKYADDHPSTGTPSDVLPIRITVTDDDSGADDEVREQTVVNIGPQLQGVALSKAQIDEGEAVTLTGTIIDPGTKDTFTLVIDWGDGKPEQRVALGPFVSGSGEFSVEHTYEDDDPETATPFDLLAVKVRIEDDDTGADEEEHTLRVDNVAPKFEGLALSAASIFEGETVTLAGSYVDPGTDDYVLEIDWGDGTEVEIIEFDYEITHFSIDHVYEDDETEDEDDVYTISVKLRDDDQGEVSEQLQISVANVAPVITATLDSARIDENDLAELTVNIEDPGTKDTFTVTVNWGDGTAAQVFQNVEAGTTSFVRTHRYLDDNPTATASDSNRITVKVEDDDKESGESEIVIVVDDVAPRNVDAGPPIVAASDQPFTLFGTFADPGTLDTHTERWVVTGPEGPDAGEGPTYTGAFGLAGTYFVTYTVTDDDGRFASANTTVMVLATPPSWRRSCCRISTRGRPTPWTSPYPACSRPAPMCWKSIGATARSAGTSPCLPPPTASSSPSRISSRTTSLPARTTSIT